MTPPNRISCYNFRVVDVVRIVDGDTIDVVFDLGFDILKQKIIEEGYAWEYEGGKKQKDFDGLLRARQAYVEKQEIVAPEWH
jgi:hypothetical protein